MTFLFLKPSHFGTDFPSEDIFGKASSHQGSCFGLLKVFNLWLKVLYQRAKDVFPGLLFWRLKTSGPSWVKRRGPKPAWFGKFGIQLEIPRGTDSLIELDRKSPSGRELDDGIGMWRAYTAQLVLLDFRLEPLSFYEKTWKTSVDAQQLNPEVEQVALLGSKRGGKDESHVTTADPSDPKVIPK